MAHQLQRGEVGLGRGQQVQGQQPGAQRQLGALEHRAGGQRGLVPAGAALVVDRRPAPKPRAGPSSAGRAAEALRPTPLVQGTVALGLGAVAGDELGHGQASLELHGIDAHDATPSPSGGRMLGGGRRTSCDWRLRVGANQVSLLYLAVVALVALLGVNLLWAGRKDRPSWLERVGSIP